MKLCLRSVFSRTLVGLSVLLILIACVATFAPKTRAQSAQFSGAERTLGGGFALPAGVAVDKGGNVFVADSSNAAVKEIVAAGGYSDVKTLGSGFKWPSGVAVDGSGNVFVSDYSGTAIKEMVAINGSIPANPVIDTLGSGFLNPEGVAVDKSGNVFVADTGNHAVKEIVAATYGNAYLNSGFMLRYPAASFSLGVHKVTVVAIDSGGRSRPFGPRNIIVATTAGAGPPFGAIGEAVDNTTGSTTVSQSHSLKVQGWVADAQDGAPLSNVKVYVDGVSIGTPTLGLPRPTIAATYGSKYLNSGFLLLYPASSLSIGTHRVTVIAVDSGGRSTTIGPHIITVQ
ncbi:MAG TPA: NHL repeat-containing protein [Terracidiphilus sp.]|jgi:hypothetical protein